jgi:hypothetical protein
MNFPDVYPMAGDPIQTSWGAGQPHGHAPYRQNMVNPKLVERIVKP